MKGFVGVVAVAATWTTTLFPVAVWSFSFSAGRRSNIPQRPAVFIQSFEKNIFACPPPLISERRLSHLCSMSEDENEDEATNDSADTNNMDSSTTDESTNNEIDMQDVSGILTPTLQVEGSTEEQRSDISNTKPVDKEASKDVTSRDVKSPTVDLMEALAGATWKGSMDLLNGLRSAAANALAASLPQEEQNVLLDRLAYRNKIDTASSTSSGGMDSPLRGSVQEEIVLAQREELLEQDQQNWEKEKERIAAELEAAATARVESELAIQQQRLEMEKLDLKGQMEASKQQLQADIEELQRKLSKAQDSVQQRDDVTQKLVQEKDNQAIKMMQQQEKEIQAILQEKKEAADALAAVKASTLSLQKEKKELEELESLLKVRKEQQEELKLVEANLRSRALKMQETRQQVFRMEDEENDLPHLSPKEYRDLSEEEKADLKARREAIRGPSKIIDDLAALSVHPILGPVVSDLGYKRIHLVSSGKLGNIPIWEKQRTYRNSRSKAMAADKAKTLKLGFPGVICLHEDTDGNLSVLDGQHRIGMMQALREKANKSMQDGKTIKDPFDENLFGEVLVEVYPQPPDVKDTDNHAEKIFLEINKAEPVKLLDMPGVASVSDRKKITEAVSSLQKQYPKMFSPSQRCRTPNVNVDNMRNAIFGANILKRHKLKSAKSLQDWLLVQNAALGGKYETDEEKRSFISTKAWEKATRLGFYLGLDSSWLYI